MKYQTLLGAMLLVALLLTACGSATTLTTEPTMEPTESVTETHLATEPAPATEPAAATESPTAGVPVTGEATIMVSDVGTFGQALVDGSGRTLYVFANDTQNSGASACT